MGKGKRGCFLKDAAKKSQQTRAPCAAPCKMNSASQIRGKEDANVSVIWLCGTMCTCQRPPNDKNFNFGFFNKTTLTRTSKRSTIFFPNVFRIFTEKQKAIPNTSKNTDYTTSDKWNMAILQFFPGFKPVWNKWRSSCHAGSPYRKKTGFRGNTALSSITEHSGLHSPSINKLVLGYNNWFFHNILKAQFLILF